MSKRKAIRIKPEFKEKLKKLKCLTKFVENSKNPKWMGLKGKDKEHKRELAENAKNSSTMLTHAFRWAATSEGYEYWDKIYQQL